MWPFTKKKIFTEAIRPMPTLDQIFPTPPAIAGAAFGTTSRYEPPAPGELSRFPSEQPIMRVRRSSIPIAPYGSREQYGVATDRSKVVAAPLLSEPSDNSFSNLAMGLVVAEVLLNDSSSDNCSSIDTSSSCDTSSSFDAGGGDFGGGGSSGDY